MAAAKAKGLAKTKAKPPWSPSEIAVQLTANEAKRLLILLPEDDPIAKSIHTKLHPKTVTVCERCGSPDIQLEAWIYFNGEADGGGDPPGGTWCTECEENDIDTKEIDAHEVEVIEPEEV